MDKIDELIQAGQQFNFRNNSYSSQYGTYSRATDDLLGWVTTVEDFILSNYGEESAPFKLYLTFQRNRLTGYEQYDFDKNMTILFGALKSCKFITPKPQKNIDDNPIISLIKKPLFWTVLVFAIGASFGLGLHFGSAKFDKEKNNYYEQTIKLNNDVVNLKNACDSKDSAINVLHERIITLNDSIKNQTR